MDIGSNTNISEVTDGLMELVDHQRWLLNNGLVSDLAKDNIYLFGSILHKEIVSVHVAIDPLKKTIGYSLYVTPRLLKSYTQYNRWIRSSKLLDLIRLRFLLKKHGSLNFTGMTNRFVKDFCGNQWSATVEVFDQDSYSGDRDEPEKAEDFQNHAKKTV